MLHLHSHKHLDLYEHEKRKLGNLECSVVFYTCLAIISFSLLFIPWKPFSIHSLLLTLTGFILSRLSFYLFLSISFFIFFSPPLCYPLSLSLLLTPSLYLSLLLTFSVVLTYSITHSISVTLPARRQLASPSLR